MLQLGLSVGSSIIEASWFSCLPPLHLWSPAPSCNELLKIQSSIQVLVDRLKQSSMKSGRWRWFWFIVKTLKTSNALCRESSIGWGFPPPSLKIVPESRSGYEISSFPFLFIFSTAPPCLTPSMLSSVSMMAVTSSMSITPLLSTSYKRKENFNLSMSWWNH